MVLCVPKLVQLEVYHKSFALTIYPLYLPFVLEVLVVYERTKEINYNSDAN